MKMKRPVKNTGRIAALFLALALMFSLLPTQAAAAPADIGASQMEMPARAGTPSPSTGSHESRPESVYENSVASRPESVYERSYDRGGGSQSIMPLLVTPFAAVTAATSPAALVLDLSSDAPQDGKGWVWDNTSHTLTLNNMTPALGGDDVNNIRLPHNSSIILQGENSIYANAQHPVGNYNGIWGSGDIAISGTGSLTINSARSGIVAEKNINIQGGTIQITSDDDAITAENITASSSNITITTGGRGIHGTHVTITGGTVDISTADGGIIVGSGAISITGGADVSVTGVLGEQSSRHGHSHGIAANRIEIANSTVNVTLWNITGRYGFAICTWSSADFDIDGTVNITNSAVNIISDKTAIIVGGITVNGSTLDLTSREDGIAPWSSGAEIIDSDITIATDHAGMWARDGGSIAITGGSTKINAGNSGIIALTTATLRFPAACSTSTPTLTR